MAAYKVILVLCLVAAISALPAQDETRSARNQIQTEDDLLDGLQADCQRKDSMACVKYKIFNLVDKTLGEKNTITVTEGVQIVKTSSGDIEGAPRALNSDATVESLILNRVQRFLQTHTVKVDLKGSDIANSVTSATRSMSDIYESFTEEDDEEDIVDEGRGKKIKKKKVAKILGPLMALAALKGAFLGKLALAGIALIAGKALITAKIALVLSAIIGIKKLLGGGGLGGGGGKQVYEVVAHPQHTSSHVSHESYGGGGGGGDIGGGYGTSGHGGGGGGGGWGRSSDAEQLAYRGQAQATKQ